MEFCDFIKLVVSDNSRCIRYFTCKDVHGVDGAVLWGDRRLCELRVL